MTHPAPPYKLKRGTLTGQAARVYIPSRRGSRHYSDAFSRALFLAKKLPAYGLQYAHDLAEVVAALVPEDADTLASPPPGRTSAARGFYFARELTVAVAGLLDLRIARPLRWRVEGAESAKLTVSHAGKARGLAKQAECVEDLTGRRVAIIDDLFTTGITAQRTAEALQAPLGQEDAGAGVVAVVTLAITERTEWRPQAERARLEIRRAKKAVQRGDR